MSDIQNNLFSNLQGNPNQPANLIATSSNPLFNDSTTNKGFFWIIKISLMFMNAFSGMIAIFVVLFGFAYPEERFPGDLKGKTCALLSIVYIGWSLIGFVFFLKFLLNDLRSYESCIIIEIFSFVQISYCGAHHQKFSFLVVYCGLVVFYVSANIILILFASKPWLDINLFYVMVAYFIILLLFGIIHAYQIRLKEERMNDDSLAYGYNQGYNYGSTYMGQLSNNLITNQPMPTQQMPLFTANQMQSNLANNIIDPTNQQPIYNMPNYITNNLTNYAPQQIPIQQQDLSNSNRSGPSNYFQRSWNRMSSKRMGNFFNRTNSTYRPNGNLITTEMKPMTFNTSMQPY